MPELLDLIEFLAECVRQGRFRQPCRNTDTDIAGDELEQSPAADLIELIEPLAEMALYSLAIVVRQDFDDLAQAECLIVRR